MPVKQNAAARRLPEWATTIGWPVVVRFVASNPMDFRSATSQSAALSVTVCLMNAGSVEMDGIRNKVEQTICCLLADFHQFVARTGSRVITDVAPFDMDQGEPKLRHGIRPREGSDRL